MVPCDAVLRWPRLYCGRAAKTHTYRAAYTDMQTVLTHTYISKLMDKTRVVRRRGGTDRRMQTCRMQQVQPCGAVREERWTWSGAGETNRASGHAVSYNAALREPSPTIRMMG